MDFKSLISKLDSMEAPPQTPAAPVLEKAVQLNEDAQLRVLSGRSTYVAEAKKKAEEDVKEASITRQKVDRALEKRDSERSMFRKLIDNTRWLQKVYPKITARLFSNP